MQELCRLVGLLPSVKAEQEAEADAFDELGCPTPNPERAGSSSSKSDSVDYAIGGSIKQTVSAYPNLLPISV